MAATGSGSENGGRTAMIVAIVAIVLVAAVAIWAISGRHRPSARQDVTHTTGTTTSGDKDVDLKVDLPDSVTIDAH